MNQPARDTSSCHPDFADLAGLLCDMSVDEDTAVTEHVYRWYVNPTRRARPDGILTAADVNGPAALRAAHAASARFEGGWRARSVSTLGRVLAERDEATRVLHGGDHLVPGRRGLVARPGDPLMVTRLVDWLDESSGFWHARSGPWPPPDADRLVRVYLNVDVGQEGRVLRLVTEVFEAAQASPYVLKVQTLAVALDRADVMVMYMSPAVFATVEGPLREVLTSAVALLRPAAPRLTSALVPGAALAEGAIDGQSYGHEVADLAGRAFAAVAPAERASVDAMHGAVCDAWLRAGYDLACPWRRPIRSSDGR